jgi:ABC-type dipeptide/oligopeptide/nickel transport system ATPase component
MTSEDFRKLRIQIHKVFLPGTPITKYELFTGRNEQMGKAMSAILQPGRHVILFGERGVGKTSLAKVLVDLQRNDGYHTLETGTINCDESDDFTSLWHKAFRVLPYTEEDGKTIYMDKLLPEVVYPDDVRYCLSRFKSPSLIVLDEVDQLKDQEAKNLLAATIKTLSDHSSDTTLILIGVADTVDELIAEHRSIQRALVEVRMPRMSSEETLQIINRGLETLNMTTELPNKMTIVMLSQRLPFYIHSLGLYSGLRAIDENRTEITQADMAQATVDVVINVHNVGSAYHKATHSPQKNSRYDIALLAFAMAPVDDLGFFTAADVRGVMSALLDRPVDVPDYKHYLNEFCEEKRGPVLQRIGEPRRYRYRFRDPLMQPFVIINAFGTGKFDMAILQRMFEDNINKITLTSDETIH